MSEKNHMSHLEQRNRPKTVKGSLFVISAPSGAGKSTLCKAVRHHFPDLLYSISYTTRPPRFDEKDGVDYVFISQKEFIEGINENRWAEWAVVHDNYYGTNANDIGRGLSAGKNILLDIDVQGANQIIQRYPNAVTIFIMPPDMNELKRRLKNRGTDNAQAISKRLQNAGKEMEQRKMYQYIIVNDHLEGSISKLLAIIAKIAPEMETSVNKR